MSEQSDGEGHDGQGDGDQSPWPHGRRRLKARRRTAADRCREETVQRGCGPALTVLLDVSRGGLVASRGSSASGRRSSPRTGDRRATAAGGRGALARRCRIRPTPAGASASRGRLGARRRAPRSPERARSTSARLAGDLERAGRAPALIGRARPTRGRASVGAAEERRRSHGFDDAAGRRTRTRACGRELALDWRAARATDARRTISVVPGRGRATACATATNRVRAPAPLVDAPHRRRS